MIERIVELPNWPCNSVHGRIAASVIRDESSRALLVHHCTKAALDAEADVDSIAGIAAVSFPWLERHVTNTAAHPVPQRLMR